MEKHINLLDFGADDTGAKDISRAFADACRKAVCEKAVLYIPQGRYKASETLRVPSNCSILAENGARIFSDGETKKKRGDYLLTNADHDGGNENISVRGGVWDGNSGGKENRKPSDIFDPDGFSGTVLNFRGVRGLSLSDFVVANAVGYHVRMAEISDFVIENIDFLADHPGATQDGLHFNGNVHRGTVRNIRALSNGLTTDDLIALNADDCMTRIENFGMICGEISDITFENLFAENCHTLIRMLSVTSPIRNITIRNAFGGFRCNAVNSDGARYCRTPIFREEEFPHGCGVIENVKIENLTCYPTAETAREAICLETLSDGLSIENFRFRCDGTKIPALRARKLCTTTVTTDSEHFRIGADEKEREVIAENFHTLSTSRK